MIRPSNSKLGTAAIAPMSLTPAKPSRFSPRLKLRPLELLNSSSPFSHLAALLCFIVIAALSLLRSFFSLASSPHEPVTPFGFITFIRLVFFSHSFPITNPDTPFTPSVASACRLLKLLSDRWNCERALITQVYTLCRPYLRIRSKRFRESVCPTGQRQCFQQPAAIGPERY